MYNLIIIIIIITEQKSFALNIQAAVLRCSLKWTSRLHSPARLHEGRGRVASDTCESVKRGGSAAGVRRFVLMEVYETLEHVG